MISADWQPDSNLIKATGPQRCMPFVNYLPWLHTAVSSVDTEQARGADADGVQQLQRAMKSKNFPSGVRTAYCTVLYYKTFPRLSVSDSQAV
jgi:hypothetical protein